MDAVASTDHDRDAITRFVGEFQARHGRAPRVLHIGNIANNAYTNARIQRRFGIDAEVLCYDYYHVMACPEWEDASFNGDLGDNNFPNWWSVDIGEWSRPSWFIQGPFQASVEFMERRNRLGADHPVTQQAARKLVGAYWLQITNVERSRGRPFPSDPWAEPNVETTRKIFPIAPTKPVRELKHERVPIVDRLEQLAMALDTGVSPRVMWRNRSWAGALDGARTPLETARLAGKVCRRVGAVALYHTVAAVKRRQTALAVKQSPGGDPRDAISKTAERAYLAAGRHEAQSERRADLNSVTGSARQVRALLAQYDVIQCYSTDGWIPLFAGYENFASYEHGTIREIPFLDDRQGRLCAFTYQQSKSVFVTNCDVLPSVSRLGLDPDRVTYLPHAFDETRVDRFLQTSSQRVLPHEDGIINIFSPSRQHWQTEPASMSKANDVFIRGFARACKDHPGLRLTLVRWGADIPATEALLGELGITDRVRWIPTLDKAGLWSAYRDAAAVADQFALPAIGGVCFEAMAMGTRVITKIAPDTFATFFGAAPPCLAADTIETCEARVREVAEDPDDTAGRGARHRAWILDYHSAKRIVSLQLQAYDRNLALLEAPAAELERGEVA